MRRASTRTCARAGGNVSYGMPAIQDLYPEDYSHCYGCGRLNPHGLHIRSEWTGDEAIARFHPQPWHVAIPGFVYGGLVAALIDCHGIGTAAAAAMVAAGARPGVDPSPRYVTASLQVDFLRPTPAGTELVLRGRPGAATERKIVVDVTLSAGTETCARGRVVAAPIPASMLPAGA